MTAPVAEWGLDEGTGSTAHDAGPGHYDLALLDATWATGHTGSGLSNTVADTGAAGTIPALSGAVTLMCWVTPLDLAAGTTKAAVGIFQGNGNTDLALFTQRGSFGTSNVLQADVRINGNLSACNGTGPLTVGTPTHIAVTYDGSTIKLYRNAVLEATTNVTGTIALGTTIYVAGALAASGVDSDVVVDDPRIFNAALTPAEIATWMDTPVATADVRTQAGTATLTLGATGTQLAERAGAGTAVLTLGASGTAVHERAAAGTAALVLGWDGVSLREAAQAGAAALALAATGTQTKEAVQAGTAVLTLLATGTAGDVTTPAGRTYVVPAESRTTVVPADGRMLIVGGRE